MTTFLLTLILGMLFIFMPLMIAIVNQHRQLPALVSLTIICQAEFLWMTFSLGKKILNVPFIFSAFGVPVPATTLVLTVTALWVWALIKPPGPK